MEVHAHTHTPRKKWTHYFWEFLMLFLAVFCGFLAENQREHFVEAHRAKEYAKSLLSDVRLDTGELRRGIGITNLTISAIDSIVASSKKATSKNTAPAAFYFYSKFISYSFRIDWSRSTLDQLIQSGNLRYLRNKDLVSLINTYYYFQGLIGAQNQIDAGHRDKTMELRNSILTNSYYVEFTKKGLLDFVGLTLSMGQNDFIVTHYYLEANKLAVEIINSLIAEYKLK
jgi:hypothetical protein